MPCITQAVSLTAVVALSDENCGKGCAPGAHATFAAVSTAVSGGAPYLYVNAHDGAHDQWEALALTGWTHDTTDVFGFQDFIMVVNGEETLPLARSVDGGKSVTYLAGNTDMATHPPLAGDMLTPDKQVLVGKDGYIYLSTDHGDTWQTVDAGVASSGEDLTQVRICRQNPAVLYASGANGAIAASYNGGEDNAAGATPYLRMFGLTVGGWLLAKQAAAAAQRLAAGEGDPAFLNAKIVTARFFAEQFLPQAAALLGPVTRGAETLFAIPEEAL